MEGKYTRYPQLNGTKLIDEPFYTDEMIIEMNDLENKNKSNEGFQSDKNDIAVAIPDYNANNQNSQKTVSNDELLSEDDENYCERQLTRIQKSFENQWTLHRHKIKIFFLILLFILYTVYIGFAISFSWSEKCSWCEGIKFLTLVTICAYVGLLYFLFLKKLLKPYVRKLVPFLHQKISRQICGNRYCGIIMFFLVMGAIFTFIVIDAAGQKERLISFGGMMALLLFGFVFSKHPRKVKISQVTWCIGLQFVFALMILRWSTGRAIFTCLANKISSFLDYTSYGSTFVFGHVADGKLKGGDVWMSSVTSDNTTLATNVTSLNVVLPHQIKTIAFSILPVVCFFSFCVSILTYYGIVQWMVIKVGWILQVTVGTTAAESMNAAANIFLGQTEAPLLIKPYIPIMTKSELHAVMTGGFATIAGAVMAAYIQFGVDAAHLLSASVMSAPAALAFSKLFYPETKTSHTTTTDIKIDKGNERNALEAATKGVVISISLVANIAANLIAVMAFIYFIDDMFRWFGSFVGLEISLTLIMAKIFTPLAYLMGVEWDKCEVVGELIGLKTIINEFVAYEKLSQIKNQLSKRSSAIATYALCGFSNLSSIGIQLGALGAMAPDRIKDLSQVALRAMIAGSAACFLTACVAGTLISDDNSM